MYVSVLIDKVQMESQPAVGVIPLGTGNDLARCLRWGGGYEGESVHKLLHKVAKATPVMMDRWSIELTDIQEAPQFEGKPNADRIPYNIINNYFSVGVVSTSTYYSYVRLLSRGILRKGFVSCVTYL